MWCKGPGWYQAGGWAWQRWSAAMEGYSAVTWLLGFLHCTHCWPLIPLSSFPGRPIPPTSSSSLLPSAQLPSSHNPPPVSCQMPLLDSNTSHQIMDTNPDEEFSPNSYLLRACSGPQQASSSGKKIANIWSLFVTCLCQFYAFFLNVCKCVLASAENWEHLRKWGKENLTGLFNGKFLEMQSIIDGVPSFYYREIFSLKYGRSCVRNLIEFLSSEGFIFQSRFPAPCCIW